MGLTRIGADGSVSINEEDNFHVSSDAETEDLRILEGLFRKKPQLTLGEATTVMEISDAYAKKLFAALGKV